MLTTVKDRLIAYLKYERINKSEFGRRIGVSNAFVTSIRASIHPDKLSSIQREFPDLDINWLMTGEGEMLREGATSPKPSPTIDETSKEMERLQLEIARLKDELLASQRKNIELLEENNRLKSALHPGLCP